jgi:adenylate cyclase
MTVAPPPAPRIQTVRHSIRPGWSYWSLVLLCACALACVGLLRPLLAPGFNNVAFDAYQRFAPLPWNPDVPVRIVDIDDESLAKIGQWPWPRSTVAALIDRLKQLGAAAIVVDIVFAEPDASSAENILSLLPSSPGRALLEQEIASKSTNDELLGRALSQVPSVLGLVLVPDGPRQQVPLKFGVATIGDPPQLFLPQFNSAVMPLAILSKGAAGLGTLNWLPDRDQIVRRVPLLAAVDTQLVPALALEAMRVVQGASTVLVRSSNASGHSAFGMPTGVNAIKVGDIEIPTDPDGTLRIRYSKADPRRSVSAWKLLSERVDVDKFDDRIILIGTSAAGLRDQRSTPVDSSVAGVEVHAQVLEQVLSSAWLRKPDWAIGAELVISCLLVIVFGLMLPKLGAVMSAIAAIASVGMIIGGSFYAFISEGLLLDPVIPGLSVGAAYTCCVVALYSTEQKRRRFLSDAFGRYVSPLVVKRLAEQPGTLALGGETKALSTMFCDMRDFTQLAESLSASDLTKFMNEYLTAMTGVILAAGGTIDKYVGDAIMAFWNAPLEDENHALNAARTALAMQGLLPALNERWAKAPTNEGKVFKVEFRIGLSTGKCVVGNFGSIQRFDYSALGDSVNLASRLERANKFYGTWILAAEATQNQTKGLPWLEVDAVRVKGKSDVSRIFTLVPDIDPGGADFAKLSKLHADLISDYRQRAFKSAGERAHALGELAPSDIAKLYQFYRLRCTELDRRCPPSWEPITALDNL